MDVENGLVGTERNGGRIREQHRQIYATVCKIESSWEAVTWEQQTQFQCCDAVEGWDGVGGKEAQGGGIIYIYSWFTVLYIRN